MDGKWREISVLVLKDAADVVSDRLIEFGSQGTVFEESEENPDLCRIKAYYPDSAESENLVIRIQHYLQELPGFGIPVGTPEISSNLIDTIDWASNWKQYFKPTKIGKHVVIKPSWETYTSRPDDIVIDIDPGMAFGSGLHASTRLLITLLEQYMRPKSNVLDVGVGSGILSIAAARLGAHRVLGLDVNGEAVAIARENVEKNVLNAKEIQEEQIELQVGSIDTLQTSELFDCILMNLRPNIILPLIPYAMTYLQTGGALIVSGILAEEGSEFVNEIRRCNLILQNHLTEEGWIAYVLSEIK